MFAISGVAIASVASVTFLFVTHQRRGFIDQLERQADLTLDSLALSAVSLPHEGSSLTEPAILPPADMADLQSRGAIFSSEGDLLAGVGDAVGELPPVLVEALGLMKSETHYIWEDTRLLAGRRVNVQSSARDNGDMPVVVVVEISTSALKHNIRQVWLDAMQVALGASAFSTLLALMLSRTITGSLKQMVAATERISSGKFSERLPTEKGGYELSVFAQSFNQMAEHLQKTIARQRALVRYSLDAIVVLDARGHTLQFNPAAERMFGCFRDEVRGRSFSEWAVTPSWRERLQRELEVVVQEDANCLLGQWQELEAQRLDGSRFPAEVSITNTDLQGDLLFTITLRDITERQQVALRLQQSEARFRQIVRSAPVGIALFDESTHLIQQVNPALCAIVGFEEASLLGVPFETLGLELPTLFAQKGLEGGGESTSADLEQVHVSSGPMDIDDVSFTSKSADSPTLQTAISDEPLQQAESSVTSSADAINLYTGPRGRGGANYEQSGTIATTVSNTANSNTASSITDGCSDIKSEEFASTGQFRLNCQIEQSYHHPSGREIWIRLTLTELADVGDGAVNLVMLEDITEHKQVEFRLRHEALHDPLTGLANRALLIKRLSRACDRFHSFDSGHAFAVLFLDCDRFKTINDTLGHEVGDRLLIAVARRLEDCVREGDTVARLGGDEFTVLLKHIRDPEEAVRVADRILEELMRPLELGSHRLSITASIGIVNSHPQYRTAEALLKDADAAMYRAKTLGRAQHAVFACGSYSD